MNDFFLKIVSFRVIRQKLMAAAARGARRRAGADAAAVTSQHVLYERNARQRRRVAASGIKEIN